MEEEKLRLRFNELDDMAVTTASAFLGLTLGCARCHDHKYDAIPTRDYYRLQCAFTTTRREEVLLATRAEAARYREQEARWKERLKAAQDELNAWLAEQKKPHAAALRNAKIDALPIGDEDKALLKEQPDSEAGEEAREAAREGPRDLGRRLSACLLRRAAPAMGCPQGRARGGQAVGAATARRRPSRSSTGRPRPSRPGCSIAGTSTRRRSRLQVGFLTVLTGARSPEDYWDAARREIASDRSTGQRRALADWITDVDQGAGPLLARVMVNRVWQHHFGEGLVRTVGDFGVRGRAADASRSCWSGSPTSSWRGAGGSSRSIA